MVFPVKNKESKRGASRATPLQKEFMMIEHGINLVDNYVYSVSIKTIAHIYEHTKNDCSNDILHRLSFFTQFPTALPAMASFPT